MLKSAFGFHPGTHLEKKRSLPMEREIVSDPELDGDSAAQRKMSYLRAYNIKLNIGGSIFIVGIFTLLYFAGDLINSYVNVGWLVLIGLLICVFYTLKYFYLAWYTENEDY
jgi:hypothetical protein